MKTNKVHPQYFDKATVTCACGTTFTVGSTQDAIRVEICSACHPFYTGQMKYVDSLGRVDDFQKKQKRGAEFQKIKAEKLQKEAERKQRQAQAPRTLREMLLGQ